ncbi:TetR/AcrR family transcriptional regulator [Microbacterium sp. P03]|uniref:TetR/AcrR family transcriptional regulator n=1 Tax=Microbacterium sp. P03 TaxID=3366946 RepID=UPI00374551FD
MPGPRRRLDERQIISQAFAVLEQSGFDGLSVRAVTARLQISAGALYTYFGGKQQLLRAMVEQLLDDLEPRRSLDEPTWQEGLRSLALRTRERLNATSGAVSLVMSGPLDGPHALAYNEVLLAHFTRAGLAIEDAARAAYTFQVYVLGFSALQAADATTSSGVSEVDLERERAESLTAWDVSAFPLTARTGAVVAGYNATGQFLWGIDRVIAGLVPATRDDGD